MRMRIPSFIVERISAGINSHKVRMYVRACVRTYVRTWVTLRNVTRNVVAYHREGRPYAGMCASRSLTHSDTLDSDIDRGRQHSLTMQRGHRGLDTTNTEHSSYSNSNTCHARA